VSPHEVVVIGAGVGGIAAAARLREQGHEVVVLEAAAELGGTWRANSYPGAGCDVPSALYSLAAAPNPDWTRHYAGRDEILAYLREAADRLGVTPLVRCSTRVLRVDRDEARRCWRLVTTTGMLEARWVVAACGPLHEPVRPDLPGLEAFRGAVFHSSAWDHDRDLRGRRVAVVGSGASALQLVPRIAAQVEHLVVLQRTPQWVLPRYDRAVPPLERRLYRRFPLLQRLVRAGVFVAAEAMAVAARRPWLLTPLRRLAARHLRRQVPDPALRARLQPPDRFGCRRLLVSDDWYPTLGQPHVTVADGNVREVRPHAVVDGTGREHAVDTIVLATGFRAADPPVARLLHDAAGRSMASHFAARGTRAHLGTTVAGFPNLFLLAGPNSLVYSSLIAVMEAQVEHVVATLAHAREQGADRIEVSPAAEDAFAAEVTARLDGAIWSSGCRSWYLDGQGRNTTVWPGTTTELRRRLRRFDPAAHEVSGPAASTRP
jgi:cation diffusion facilitator CzcD-associated flavoprotein CzcO